MAKNKRKISSAQRDKTVIELAKILKKNGILSKQTKLHSGNYVSRGVLSKVRKMGEVAYLDYKAYPAKKTTVVEAKSKGFLTVGNKIIGPKTAQFRKRISEGMLTGVRPVKGGLMEQVYLPHNIMDMHGLIQQLEAGIDNLKAPGEMFAFKFYGNESYRAFPNTDSLLEYLKHYKAVFSPNGSLKAEDLQEEFENLTFFRLHPETQARNLRGPTRRAIDKKNAIRNGTYVNHFTTQDRRLANKPTMAQKLAQMHPQRAERIRKAINEREARKREAIMANPAEYAKYKERGRERARLSRERAKVNKGKGKK